MTQEQLTAREMNLVKEGINYVTAATKVTLSADEVFRGSKELQEMDKDGRDALKTDLEGVIKSRFDEGLKELREFEQKYGTSMRNDNVEHAMNGVIYFERYYDHLRKRIEGMENLE